MRPLPISKLAAHVLIAFSLVAPVCAQYIKVLGGASTMVPAQGGAFDFEGGNYHGYLGLGMIDGRFRFGTNVQTAFGPYHMTFGDDPVRLDLPTDIFDNSHYVLVRGIGTRTQKHHINLYGFVGATAFANGAPFFQAASSQSKLAMVFADIPLTDRLHFYSKNIISSRQTSIHGINWRAKKWLQTSAAFGIGSNQRYFATSLQVEHDWLSVKAAFVGAGDHFRRITVLSPLGSEIDGANLLVTLHPHWGLNASFGHQNYVQPQSNPSADFLHGSVNHFQASYDFHEYRFGGAFFQSEAEGRHNLGEGFWGSRRITSRIDAGLNYFRNKPDTGAPTSSLAGLIRENLSARLNLLQLINHSNGQTNVSFGGNYTSNRFSIGLDYQTIYVPLRNDPFRQGLGLSVRLRPWGDVELNGQSYVDPAGKVRYTATGSTFLYRSINVFGGHHPQTISNGKYIIRGRVTDEHGSPVEGAALRIDNEIVLTNASGVFFVRKKKAGLYALEVVFEEFENPAPLELVTAPRTVAATPEDGAPEILIVVREKSSPK